MINIFKKKPKENEWNDDVSIRDRKHFRVPIEDFQSLQASGTCTTPIEVDCIDFGMLTAEEFSKNTTLMRTGLL